MTDQQLSGPRHRRKKKKSSPKIDRQPPFNLEAEAGVLGSLMLTPDACDDIVSILRPEDFYDEAHAIIYRHMMELHSKGEKVDLLLLRERLAASGDDEMVGGAARLAEIFTSVPHAAHVQYYAQIVRNKATARNLITTCSELLNDAFEA